MPNLPLLLSNKCLMRLYLYKIIPNILRIIEKKVNLPNFCDERMALIYDKYYSTLDCTAEILVVGHKVEIIDRVSNNMYPS